MYYSSIVSWNALTMQIGLDERGDCWKAETVTAQQIQMTSCSLPVVTQSQRPNMHMHSNMYKMLEDGVPLAHTKLARSLCHS